MKISSRLTVAGMLILALSESGLAQQPIIYPAQGQSASQQEKDRGECQIWATKNTGVDPVALAQGPAAAAPQAAGGQRARGAVRGAVGGAAVGAIAGDTGKGAGIGATLGTMRAGREARRKQAEQQEQQQTAESRRQLQMKTWDRAFAACMEGRGYTLK